MLIRFNVILILFLFLFFSSCKSKKTISSSENTNTKTQSNAIVTKYAEKLKVSKSDIKNEKLYSFIDDWYGVPYKYAGKSKSGIDCSALTSTLYREVYQLNISPSTKLLINEAKKIKKSDLKEGDLVFFKINSDKPSHVGVYLQNQKFVHASTKKGVMISDLAEPFFVQTFYSAGRIR